jgi:hypothetical protein
MVKIGPAIGAGVVTMAQPSNIGSILTTPDMTLVNELYEAIELNPPAIEARKLLVEHYLLVGWTDAANDAIAELLKLVPKDEMAKISTLAPTVNAVQPEPKASTPSIANKPISPLHIDDLQSASREFAKDYTTLRERAQKLQNELRLVGNLPLQRENAHIFEKLTHDINALADGHIRIAVRARQPGSVKVVARKMEDKPHQALEIAISDLTDMANWLRAADGQQHTLDNDAVREALAKRVRALIAALPTELQDHASTALMHVEHEVLRREYVCKETLLGDDPIADIPRANFWVSEDGYAWDMEELAQAIKSNDGVMRNPLSKQMFTPNDVRAIVKHPLGKGLGALQIEQSKLRKGVRPATVKRLADLAKVLKADMSDDQMASRHAIDDFLAYVATLPDTEQKSIDKLRVPAKDSHTGLPFDSTIGEAVRDAQGNRVCIHKTAEFIGQAARHLA